MIEMREIYILISNGGDGSYYPQFVDDPAVIAYLQERSDNDELDWDAMGVDGDGFHYTTIKVPASLTNAQIGIKVCTLEDVKSAYPSHENED